jgi:DNA-binding NarL/FixJ family response regulator
MPNVPGTELASRLREIDPDLKVIIITGYSDKFSEELLSQSGISEVILKPMILDDFSKVIRRVLDNYTFKTN